MRKAVVHIDVDPGRILSPVDVTDGIVKLTDQGFVVHRRGGGTDLELVVESENPDDARHRTAEVGERAFGTTPSVGAVTFISRGSDDDALGVIEAFGVRASLERIEEGDDEVAIFTLPSADRRRVPESRLHTALEAALNCEVRIRFA